MGLIETYEASSRVKTLLNSQRVDALKALCVHYELSPARSGVRGVSIKPDYVTVLTRFHLTRFSGAEKQPDEQPRKRARLDQEPSERLSNGDVTQTRRAVENSMREENMTEDLSKDVLDMEVDSPEFPEPLEILRGLPAILDSPARSVRTSKDLAVPRQRVITVEALENKFDIGPRRSVRMHCEDNGDLELAKVALAFGETRPCKIIDPARKKVMALQSVSLADGFVRNFLSQGKTSSILVTFNSQYAKDTQLY